jgi:glycosyltransferase involved in cell wall biosynthesis
VRIAIFDYQVVRNNPVGGCHLRLLRALAYEHEFTVFSVAFENPCPSRIKWIRVPAPRRPLPLLFVVYHILAPLLYWIHLARTRTRFDVVQMVPSNLSFGTVAYSHFCHTSYLTHHWSTSQATGLRGFSRWLDHKLHSIFENRLYAATKEILVPSTGLSEELGLQFPEAAKKIRVLPNAIDVKGLRQPASFDREQFRGSLGIRSSDVVFIFSALGHFERKGLPLLMESLARLNSDRAKLLVVGGTRDLVESYKQRAEAAGLRDRILFLGMQSDVRPYLWAADALTIASTYETFSLVAFEAAAAGLPLITPVLHGVKEITRHGETGYIVKRTVEAFADAFTRFLELQPEARYEMGDEARLAAMEFDEARFVDNWRSFYREQEAALILSNDALPSAQPAGRA